jgi:hypothetical protein
MAIPDWPRQEFRPGGGDALLYYAFFGPVPEDFRLDGQAYRCAGVPRGMALDQYDRQTQPAPFEFAHQPVFAEALEELGTDIAGAVREAQECLLLHGTVADPPDLNYLRDSVGLGQFLLDRGASAALDVQTLTWFTRERWRDRLFDPAGPVPTHHTVILFSEDLENEGRFWYHTRGMRKFGRPDISIRKVPQDQRERVAELCNRLIVQQAFGGSVEEGREVVMAGLPEGMRCHHAGNLEDPDFNNVHVEITFPAD